MADDYFDLVNSTWPPKKPSENASLKNWIKLHQTPSSSNLPTPHLQSQDCGLEYLPLSHNRFESLIRLSSSLFLPLRFALALALLVTQLPFLCCYYIVYSHKSHIWVNKDFLRLATQSNKNQQRTSNRWCHKMNRFITLDVGFKVRRALTSDGTMPQAIPNFEYSRHAMHTFLSRLNPQSRSTPICPPTQSVPTCPTEGAVLPTLQPSYSEKHSSVCFASDQIPLEHPRRINRRCCFQLLGTRSHAKML